jgi:hypothetical protein
MKSGVKIPLIALFFITTATPAGVPLRAVIPSVLYAQTGTDAAGEAIVEKEKREDAGSVAVKEEPAVKEEAAPPVKPVQRPRETADEAAARKKPVEQKTPPLEEPREAYSGDGLLDITDGAFRYRRIPGIRITEAVVETAPPVAVSENDKVSASEGDEREGKGLFGMSRSATDTIARVVLIGIIILIFVLYRFRARNRRSSVLKRFPKA